MSQLAQPPLRWARVVIATPATMISAPIQVSAW